MENCNAIMDNKTSPLAANYEDEGMMDDMELEVTIKGAIMEERDVLSPSQVKSPPDEDVYYNRESGRKICGVCKRSAKRSHFGALCCDSCRAFFRRSVQNSVWETFICFKGNRCDISENRRSCQSCRFARCQDIGMDMSLVMTEEDRKALMTRKLEKRRQIVSEHKRHESTANHGMMQVDAQPLLTEQRICSDEGVQLGSDEAQQEGKMTSLSEVDMANGHKIKNLQRDLRLCLSFQDFPPSHYEVQPEIMESLFITFCKNMGRFFSSIPEFRNLDPAYQELLLKPAVAKAMFILGTYQFDLNHNCWPRVLSTPDCTFPIIPMSTMEDFIDDDRTMWKWKDYIKKYQAFHTDEVVALLTVIISLFDHKDLNTVEIPDISIRKTRYIQLFKFFLQKQFGETSHTMYCLWDVLRDVEELRECFEHSATN